MTTAETAAFENHVARGRELLRKDDVDSAKREFGKALSMHAEDPTALALMGLVCFRKNEFEDALPIIYAPVQNLAGTHSSS